MRQLFLTILCKGLGLLREVYQFIYNLQNLKFQVYTHQMHIKNESKAKNNLLSIMIIYTSNDLVSILIKIFNL